MAMDDYTPIAGRRIIAAPEQALQGTSVLVVTIGKAGVYRIETAKVDADGFTAQRDVFEARTKGEIKA
jgi:hypothetical protein